MKLEVRINLIYADGITDESNIETQATFHVNDNAKAVECNNTMVTAMTLDGYSMPTILRALEQVHRLYEDIINVRD